jgi:hypothetical protein
MTDPEHKHCLGCGYILDGLPELRCPECGREFDPADPGTYHAPGPQAGRALLIAAAVGASATVLASTLGLWELRVGDEAVGYGDWAPGLIEVAGVLCCLIVTGRALDQLRRGHLTLRERGRSRYALLISAIAVLLFLSSCPLSRGADHSLHYGPLVLRLGNGANR